MSNNITNNPQVYPVHESEANQMIVAEIRFDCTVTMFDCAFPNRPQNQKPPQWFKAEMMLTLEGLRNEKPEMIGARIKQMMVELENRIDEYLKYSNR